MRIGTETRRFQTRMKQRQPVSEGHTQIFRALMTRMMFAVDRGNLGNQRIQEVMMRNHSMEETPQLIVALSHSSTNLHLKRLKRSNKRSTDATDLVALIRI